MIEDQIKWDKKFSARKELSEAEPFIFQLKLDRAKVIDLASGDGRNAIAMAESGAEVTAVDISQIGLENLRKHAEQRNLHIRTLQADLDEPLGLNDKFDIVVINYFKPGDLLWSQIHNLLTASGEIIFATFNLKKHSETGFPRRFCLLPEEFTAKNRHLECVSYKSGVSCDLSGEECTDMYRFKLAAQV